MTTFAGVRTPMLQFRNAVNAALQRSAELAGYTNLRIYHYAPPPGTASGWVEWRIIAGGDMNSPGRPHIEVEVEIFATSTSEDQAITMAEAIDTTMNGTSINGVIMEGWDNYYFGAGNWLFRKFWADGQEWWQVGKQYTVRLVKRG